MSGTDILRFDYCLQPLFMLLRNNRLFFLLFAMCWHLSLLECKNLKKKEEGGWVGNVDSREDSMKSIIIFLNLCWKTQGGMANRRGPFHLAGAARPPCGHPSPAPAELVGAPVANHSPHTRVWTAWLSLPFARPYPIYNLLHAGLWKLP